MKKILITYGTAGEGHKRAAFAIKEAFDVLSPTDCEVKIVDTLDYTNPFFKWFYPRCYIFMVSYIPTIWGFFYYLLDFKCFYPVVRFVRRIVNKKNTKAFEEFLADYKPDAVLTTHFLASEVIANLKRQDRIKTKLVTCVTDFRMHSFWYSEQTNHFLVGFSETKTDLVKKWKIPADKIDILGIPIHPEFYISKNKDEIRARMNISKDLFTVLITGGGFGVGPIMSLVKILSKLDIPLQILVVCGHNEKLRSQIDKLSTIDYRLSTIVKSFDFIDYVDELMLVSDVGITKAGGLICSEALARWLPLIIISPIPGQEGRNCKLLLRNNVAFKINRPVQAIRVIRKMYSDPKILEEMREHIMRIRKENPAENIARFVMENTDVIPA